MRYSVIVLALAVLSAAAGAASANSSQTQMLIQLSDTHLQNIASGNLNLSEQGYLPNAYVFVNINFTNISDTYYGTSGIANALSGIISYGTPYTYYTQNTSVAEINSTAFSVNRQLWFVSKNQSYTLKIPYAATYVYVQGAWEVLGEWFGISSQYGILLSGAQAPATQTTTTIQPAAPNTTVAQQPNTTTLLYTLPFQSNSSATQASAPSVNLLYPVLALILVAIVAMYYLTVRKRS